MLSVQKYLLKNRLKSKRNTLRMRKAQKKNVRKLKEIFGNSLPYKRYSFGSLDTGSSFEGFDCCVSLLCYVSLDFHTECKNFRRSNLCEKVQCKPENGQIKFFLEIIYVFYLVKTVQKFDPKCYLHVPLFKPISIRVHTKNTC